MHYLAWKDIRFLLDYKNASVAISGENENYYAATW